MDSSTMTVLKLQGAQLIDLTALCDTGLFLADGDLIPGNRLQQRAYFARAHRATQNNGS